MKYQPTKFNTSVNYSKSNDLTEFVKLFLVLSIILAIIYVSLGLLVDVLIPRVSTKTEQFLWQSIRKNYVFVSDDKKIEYLNSLIEKLPPQNFPENYKPTIVIMKDDQINAFAAPGGFIVLTSGLLDNVKSENGLMFVIGHEIGHFINHDHLRSFGRGILIGSLSSFIFGSDGMSSSLISKIFLGLDNNYSRQQEKLADEWGLKTLIAQYGHVGGAVEFFDVMKELEKNLEIFMFFSTHPTSQERIKNINFLIKKNNYLTNQVVEIQNF